MKIYVASSWRSKEFPDVVERLRAAGHEVYDFRDTENSFHWSDIDPGFATWGNEEYVDHLASPLAEAGFKSDLDAMKWADACVLVVPTTPGRSSHLELGWMAGAGKFTVVLLTSDTAPELMYKLADHVVVDVADVLIALRDHAQRAPNCKACAHSFMEPDGDPRLICGLTGKYLPGPRAEPAPTCGPDWKFEQHPKRNPDRSLE